MSDMFGVWLHYSDSPRVPCHERAPSHAASYIVMCNYSFSVEISLCGMEATRRFAVTDPCIARSPAYISIEIGMTVCHHQLLLPCTVIFNLIDNSWGQAWM